ncbi:MAG: hypothetical protein AAF658_15220 [Myxococcota bacterium]
MESTSTRVFDTESPIPELSESESEGDKPPAASLELVSSFDLDRVPMHLREIFVYAQAWGTIDDRQRRERIDRLSEGELRQIADAVAPYLDDIVSWESQAAPCLELRTYQGLAVAHREIEASLNAA